MNGTIEKPASPKQLKWLNDLLNNKDYSTFPEEWRKACDRIKRAFEKCIAEGYEANSLNTWIAANEGNQLTHNDFQRLLPKLQEAPTAATIKVTGSPVPTAEQVPAGRYALPTGANAINQTAFYKVDRPTEGKWAGRVFVKLMLSDQEQRMSRATAEGVLVKIHEYGAEKSMALYGHEFGHCGVCGRGLTNDESRERGIGPICAAKMGW